MSPGAEGCIFAALNRTNIHLRELTMSEFDTELDARGLNCPLPILRAKKAIGGMGSGEILKVVATDAGSVKDFEAFCRQSGDELMDSSQDGSEYHFLIKKA